MRPSACTCSSRTFFKSGIAAAMVLMLLSACTVFKLPGTPPELFNLTPKSTFSDDLPQIDQQLIIEEPIAAGGLDTSRIALRPQATRLQFFADSRWTERAPKMIQTLLIESFENTNRITAVGRQSIGLRSDYVLKTELREFQAEKVGESQDLIVHVRINAKLVKQPQRTIVGSKSFEESVSVNDGGGIDAIVAAFDQATGKVMKNLVEWTLTNME